MGLVLSIVTLAALPHFGLGTVGALGAIAGSVVAVFHSFAGSIAAGSVYSTIQGVGAAAGAVAAAKALGIAILVSIAVIDIGIIVYKIWTTPQEEMIAKMRDFRSRIACQVKSVWDKISGWWYGKNERCIKIHYA